MKHITVIDAYTGGFILVDQSVKFNARLAATLSVLFDREDEEQFAAVPQLSRTEAESIANGGLAVVAAEQGYLYVSVQDESPTDAEKARIHSTGRLRLEIGSGSLILSNGTFLFDGLDASDCEDESIAVEPGLYDITVYALSPDPVVVPTVGVFGDDESPAVIVHLTKAGAVEDRPIDVRVDMSDWTREPVSGAICAVTVTKVDGDEATAAIQLTSHEQSGRARFTVPSDVNVGVGEECWVLLERDEGKYWTASLIQE